MRDHAPEYIDYWQQHIDKSQESILALLSQYRDPRVLIVGMGNAMEIPLTALAHSAREVTVILR